MKNLIQKARKGNEKVWEYDIPSKFFKQKFVFHLESLKQDYRYFKSMTDVEFSKVENLIKASHFACIVGYYKNLTPEETLLDDGVIHELVHYLQA